MEQVFISEQDIANHLFKELVKLKYAPSEDELDDLAMIIFDYLLSLGLMDEMEDEE